MPITPRSYEARPYVRPAYEPDTRTLRELLQMAGQARSQAAGQRGQIQAQGLMRLGDILSQGLGGLRQDRERSQMAAVEQQRYADEQMRRQRAEAIQLAQLESLHMDREADNARQAEAARVAQEAQAYKRGGEVAEEVGYGPMDEAQLQAVMQGPASGRARYVFGLGTAEGPELQPTPQQRRGIAAEEGIRAMGGQIGPNGQVIMPPKPEQPPNPTESSLALLAASGDPNAIKALEILKRQRPQASSGPRQMTQTAESQLISRWSTQWTAAAKPIKDLERQVSLMDTGMEAVKRGDLAQGAQMVLVTFQKILDPPSVVRESEFLRSAAGQALMTRVRGAYERLIKGGAGVPADELQKFAELAREAATAQRNAAGLDKMRARLGRNADRYGIPHDLIFDEDAPSAAVDTDSDVEEWGFDDKGNLVKKPKGGG